MGGEGRGGGDGELCECGYYYRWDGDAWGVARVKGER